MPIFNYKAKNDLGRKKRGHVVAINESEAIKNLNHRGLIVLSIIDSTRSLEHRIARLLNPVRKKDLVVFSRQFSIMILANVTVTESLLTIIDQTNNLKFRNILSEVAYDVDNGSFLSDALAQHRNVFSNFFINVIKAGETSGKLDEVLNYLADEIEKDYDLNKRFRGALAYPAFVICGLLAVGFIFIFFVLPELTSILEETGTTLPLATRIVIFVTNLLKNYYLIIFGLIIAMIVGLRFVFRTVAGRKALDIFLVKSPILGKIFQLVYLVRLTRSLGVLLKGGVNIIRSLEIVGDIVRNTVYKEIIIKTVNDINEGGSVISAFEKSDYVPKMIPQMMSVGEKTGKLEESLENISNFYQKELNSKLANLNTILEPAIMVVMGVGVAIMVAAIIMPMYNMASQF